MKSVGDCPDSRHTALTPDTAARSKQKPAAIIARKNTVRKPASNRLLPVVQMNTGSGTKP